MTERAHAVLSASSSHRWLNCPPSALLCADAPDTAGDAAAQGTAAHALAEHKLRRALKKRSRKPVSEWVDDEMETHTGAYAAWVVEQAAQLDNPMVLIEERLDFSRWVPDGFGTGDCILVSDGVLHVIDFKYGQGVVVDAVDNPQMKLYALGAWFAFGLLYDIETIRMSIHQPRRDNVSTWSMPLADLLAWAEQELAPVAALAASGEGDFAAGEWCRWCALKSTCRARAEANLALAQLEFKSVAELTDDEISEVLAQLPQLTAWANDVQTHALTQALAGHQWPGFKLVAGRSVRRWADPDAVADRARAEGVTDIWDRKLIGIPAMEKLLGRQVCTDLLGDLIEKPEGKPVLVPASDTRPELAGSDPTQEFQPVNQ